MMENHSSEKSWRNIIDKPLGFIKARTNILFGLLASAVVLFFSIILLNFFPGVKYSNNPFSYIAVLIAVIMAYFAVSKTGIDFSISNGINLRLKILQDEKISYDCSQTQQMNIAKLRDQPIPPSSRCLILELPERFDEFNSEEFSKALKERIARLIAVKNVIFIDYTGKYIAFTPSSSLAGIIQDARLTQDFIRDLHGDNRETLPSRGDVFTECITQNATNFNALQIMYHKNIDALPIVTEDEKAIAIITREQVLSRFMIGLFELDSGNSVDK